MKNIINDKQQTYKLIKSEQLSSPLIYNYLHTYLKQYSLTVEVPKC